MVKYKYFSDFLIDPLHSFPDNIIRKTCVLYLYLKTQLIVLSSYTMSRFEYLLSIFIHQFQTPIMVN